MDPATIAALASAVSAATGVGGALFGGNNTVTEQLTANQLQDARNRDQYQQALNALMLRNAQSGYTDSGGSNVSFDPGTNTWNARAGPQQDDAYRSMLSAIINRNTRDVAGANDINDRASSRAIGADSSARSLLNRFDNYDDVSPNTLRAALTRSSVDANSTSMRSIVPDMLRSFARTGTDSGPALASVQAQGFNNLKAGMNDAVVNSYKGAADINNSNRNSILGSFAQLNQSAQPQQQQPQIGSYDSNAALANIVAARTGAMAGAGQAATYGNASGASNMNNAYNAAIRSANTMPTFSQRLTQAGKNSGELFTSLFQPLPNETTNNNSSAFDKLLGLLGGNTQNNADVYKRNNNVYGQFY